MRLMTRAMIALLLVAALVLPAIFIIGGCKKEPAGTGEVAKPSQGKIDAGGTKARPVEASKQGPPPPPGVGD